MRNFIKHSICFLIVFLLLQSVGVYAIPNPNNEFYVYDRENILDHQTENYIIETNLELHEKTGAQIVWAVINDLEGMDINTYATALFDEWDIGGRELDNGLLVLIVPEDGEIWIEVGYGLEGILPDSRVKRIIENNILPHFSQGDYNGGALSGHEEILNYMELEYNVELSSREGEYSTGNHVIESRFPNVFLMIGIIIFLFIDFKFFRGWLTFSLLRGLGRRGGGGGSNRGSRGGGGRSGGGGAGGRW